MLETEGVTYISYLPQLKAVCVDESLKITHEFCVVFDKDLPEFKYVLLISYIRGKLIY